MNNTQHNNSIETLVTERLVLRTTVNQLSKMPRLCVQ